MRVPTRFSCNLLFLLFVAVVVTAPAIAQRSVDGHWKGAIEVPGQSLQIDVDLVTSGESISGDISIPAQGLRDLALTDLFVQGTALRFKIPGIPGDPTFDGALSDDGTRITGTFRQSGSEFPFELARADDPATAARAALDGFEEFIAQAVKDFNVPGVGLAVVAGGEVVFAEGVGYRDLENELPMTPDTLFAIGSTTKAMTSTVLGMFVDDGKLEWDEGPLPQLPAGVPAERPGDLRPHHTPGPRYSPFGDAAPRSGLVQQQRVDSRRDHRAHGAPRVDRGPAVEVPVQQPDVHDGRLSGRKAG